MSNDACELELARSFQVLVVVPFFLSLSLKPPVARAIRTADRADALDERTDPEVRRLFLAVTSRVPERYAVREHGLLDAIAQRLPVIESARLSAGSSVVATDRIRRLVARYGLRLRRLDERVVTVQRGIGMVQIAASLVVDTGAAAERVSTALDELYHALIELVDGHRFESLDRVRRHLSQRRDEADQARESGSNLRPWLSEFATSWSYSINLVLRRSTGEEHDGRRVWRVSSPQLTTLSAALCGTSRSIDPPMEASTGTPRFPIVICGATGHTVMVGSRIHDHSRGKRRTLSELQAAELLVSFAQVHFSALMKLSESAYRLAERDYGSERTGSLWATSVALTELKQLAHLAIYDTLPENNVSTEFDERIYGRIFEGWQLRELTEAVDRNISALTTIIEDLELRLRQRSERNLQALLATLTLIGAYVSLPPLFETIAKLLEVEPAAVHGDVVSLLLLAGVATIGAVIFWRRH